MKIFSLQHMPCRWLALASFSLLGACGGKLNDSVALNSTDQLIFSARLDGSQETPPNGSPGSGLGLAVVNARDLSFSASVVTSGVAETVAHIHEAPPGVAGPVVFALTKEAGKVVWNVQGTLTPAQLNTMRAGGLYLNVHSATSIEGEIRGQIQFRLPTREQIDRLALVAQQSGILQNLLRQAQEQVR